MQPICKLCKDRKYYQTYEGGDWHKTSCPECNPINPWYNPKKDPNKVLKAKKENIEKELTSSQTFCPNCGEKWHKTIGCLECGLNPTDFFLH